MRFTIQLVTRTPGRLWTCEGCDRVALWPENVIKPMCHTCSPFTHIVPSRDGNPVGAYTTHVATELLVRSLADVGWNQDLPTVLRVALENHFSMSSLHVKLMPDPHGERLVRAPDYTPDVVSMVTDET